MEKKKRQLNKTCCLKQCNTKQANKCWDKVQRYNIILAWTPSYRMIVQYTAGLERLFSEIFQIRECSFSYTHVSINSVFCTILNLVELIGEWLTKELGSTKGAILFDEWTIYRMNYIEVYGCFNSWVPVRENYQMHSKLLSRLQLLTISTMAEVNIDYES